MAERLSIGTPPARSFPYPPFQDVHLRAVVAVLRSAWPSIAAEEREKSRAFEPKRKEKDLNAAMAMTMNVIRLAKKIPNFTADDFDTPVWDAAANDYTGKSVDVRPDITIHLRSIEPGLADPSAGAIYIECKCLGQTSNLNPYFSTGVKKFVDGWYAWAVQQAFMVAYVDTSQELPTALEEGLVRCNRETRVQLVFDNKRRAVRPSGQRYLAYTRHRREWPHRNGDAPGDIELLHVWLFRTE